MIHEIAPAEFSVGYDTRPPQTDAFLFLFAGGTLCGRIDAAGTLILPKFGETNIDAKDCTFLFTLSNHDYFSAPFQTSYGTTFGTVPLREAMSFADDVGAFAAATAYHLAQWYRHTRFCGACAARLERDAKERAMRCPSCGAVVYPRIDPSIVVGVIDGDNLLLTKYTQSHGQDKYYALIAGFCEIGESAEDTVRREVWEEVGLRVKNIRYWGSQPWGVAGNLTLGFLADLDGGAAITMDESELARALWVPRAEVPVRGVRLSLTAEMMKAFHDGKIE